MGIAMVVSWRRAEAGPTDAPGSWAMHERSQIVGALSAVWGRFAAIWRSGGIFWTGTHGYAPDRGEGGVGPGNDQETSQEIDKAF